MKQTTWSALLMRDQMSVAKTRVSRRCNIAWKTPQMKKRQDPHKQHLDIVKTKTESEA